MKNILILTLCFFTTFGQAQESFHRLYTDYTFKVDDYVYLLNDTLAVSSVEPFELEKCKIKINEFAFSVDDGGMGFAAEKVMTKVDETREEFSIYSIKGPYGDRWNVMKTEIGGKKLIGIFHARIDKQPVFNYTLYGTDKLTRKEISDILLRYLSIERENASEFHVIEVDKYEIADKPMVKNFVKRAMKQ